MSILPKTVRTSAEIDLFPPIAADDKGGREKIHNLGIEGLSSIVLADSGTELRYVGAISEEQLLLDARKIITSLGRRRGLIVRKRESEVDDSLPPIVEMHRPLVGSIKEKDLRSAACAPN